MQFVPLSEFEEKPKTFTFVPLEPVQSEPILSPEELMMGSVGAPNTEPPPQPRKPSNVPEMRAYEPSIADQFLNLFPGDRAKSANEANARRIAREQGISVDEAYRQMKEAVGVRGPMGARPSGQPMFNPEGRAPIKAAVEATPYVFEGIKKAPAGAAEATLRAIRGGAIEDSIDQGFLDQIITNMADDKDNLPFDPNYQGFQGLGKSLGFSLASMVSSAVAGTAATVATGGNVPIGIGAGMAASGTMAYRASKDDFLNRLRDKLNKDSERLYGTKLTTEQWQAARDEFDAEAVKYGAWEAVPEALSNAIFLKAFAKPAFTAGAKRLQGLMDKAGALAVENITETATGYGQNAAEFKAGLTNDEIGIVDAFKQQFIQTGVMMGVMGGGMKGKQLAEKFYNDQVLPRVNPGSALAKAIKADIDAVAYSPEAIRQEAVRRLRPDQAQYEMQGLEPVPSVRPATITPPEEEPIVAPPAVTSPVAGATNLTFVPLSEAPKPGGRVEPSLSEAPITLAPEPRGRVEPPLESAPPPAIVPPKVEAVPGMMTEADLAQPENLTITPVTVTEPEVTPVSPALTETPTKDKWLKAINDQNRLQPEGGVQLTVTPEGKLNFMGDPSVTKQGRALDATLHEAIKAGATIEEIAASILSAQRPAPPVTPVTPIKPTPAAASLPESPTVPPAKTPKLFEPTPAEHQAQDMSVVAVPVKDLTLSKDVPQFKAGASDKGVVEPLSGKFTQEGVAPIAVWRRLDGTMEVISGRHRLDLAKRTGTELINAQVYDEASGFDKAKAAILDAELNIRDEQGKVKDYVNYFKASGTDRETADAKGFLARTKGKRGFTIANQGSDALVAAINSDQIGDEAAYYVAINAPNDERLQNVGLQSIMDGKSMNTAVNTMQAVKAMAVEQDTTTDMFGFDDSLIKEAQEMAKIASKMQQSIQTRLAAITGAAKNPAMAKAEGIDVRDPNAIKRRIEELRAQKAALENWSTSPELVAEIRAARGVEAPQLELRGETEAEIRAREATQDVDRQAQEEKDIADRERDFFQLQPQVAEREEAPTVDMFGAADMAQQPARTAPTAPPITEGLFAPTAKPEAKPLSKEMQQVKKLMLAEEDMYFTDDAQELQGALKNKNWVAYAGRPVYEARGKRKSELIDVQDLEKINTQEELDAALEQGKQIGFLEADKVTAKPTQAVDEEAATIVDDTTTPAQREDAETHAKDVGGTIVWQQGENALIRGYSMLTGDPVYIPTFGTSRARIDIESFSGAQLSPELKRDMIDAKKKAEQDAEEKHKRNPFVKFVDKVAVSEGISSEIEGVIREWKKLLKLDIPLYVGTIEDARRNKDEYTGPHRRIGSGTLDKGEAGSTRRMADGSHYILLSKSTSPTYMLETLAHELGHIHQKIVYENASPADKNALQNAHKKWLESQKGKTAKELIDSLRGRATQRRPKPSASQKAEDLTSYWRSFSEWYADQTSRWAMSDKVPVTAVEKFFKRLGNQLRRFYQQLKARKYLPDDTFAQYINRVTESTPALVPDQDDIANQMSIETEPSKDSSAEPSQGVDGAATDDKNLLEKYNRPNTPQLDPTPLKTEIVDAGKLGKDFFTYAVSDPLEALGSAANSVDRAILYARNKNVWFGSGLNAADFSKYNGELQTSQGLATASVALDNAIRGGQIAAEVIFQGGIKFDQKSRNFVAVKRNKGMAGVYEAEIALKKRLGDQLGTDIIQGYLEAKRSRSIQNEYFAREAEYELFKNDYEELRAANAPEEDIMAARDAMAEAKGGLAAIEVVYNKIRMSDPEIDEFIARDAVHPELRKIMDNWSAINQNMLAFWRQVGLLSEKRYENLSNIKDYVPWQRIMNDETDVHSPVQASNRKMTNIGLEKLFKKGAPTVITDFVAKDGQQTFKIQPATVLEVEINGEPVAQNKVTATADGQVKLDVPVTEGDLVVFKASREIENIIDNMTRNVMRMTMNGLRQAAAQRIVMEYATRNKKGKIMMFPKADKERGRFDFIVNGQRVVVEIQDPLIAESIFGMESLDIAMLAPLAAVANFTRRTITLSGVFQIKQVFKDAPTAALVTGVKRPLVLIGGVYKGFVTSLLNTDPTIKILKAAGIGGFQSLARTPEAEIKRRLGIMNRNVFDFVIKGLDHIGDASDMAQRVAVYKRVLAETGNETQALYQAANVINFLHHGSGQVSQAIVKTVPFAGAYANSMDVLIQALAGGGLKGRSRANALARLAATGTLLAGITLLYCFLVGDDEDYNQMDDQTKLRNFMIPGTKILLPMNTSAAYFYKAIPEMIYNRVVKEGTNNAVDERRLRTALKKAAVDMLLGPTPVPSAIKPFIELGLNKDFFTGRAVVPEALAKLDAAERYTAATSEAGKYLSSLTGTPEKRLLDPIEADHLIRGLFGTAGAMVQWFTNSIAVATGDRPALTDKEQPITGPFLRADVGRRNEDLFYDFKSVVDNKYGTFAKMLEREDEEAAEAYEEKHSDVLVFYKSVNKMEDDLKNINKTIRYYGESKGTGLTPDQRREEIKLLQLDKQEILDDVIEMRQEAGL